MYIWAVVNDEEGTDGVPALFLDESRAEEYAFELNGNNVDIETYIVVMAEVQE